MSIVVIRDPKDREREEAQLRRFQELQDLLAAKRPKEPTVVMETTCPECGHKRYVPLGPKDRD